MKLHSLASIILCAFVGFVYGDTPVTYGVKTSDDSFARSESDRFIGMLYESQCMEPEARKWYTSALIHYPKNTAAKKHLDGLSDWIRTEQLRLLGIAIETGKDTDMANAFVCGYDNPAIKRFLIRLHTERMYPSLWYPSTPSLMDTTNKK